jgi:SAM-dependent methyltransferase
VLVIVVDCREMIPFNCNVCGAANTTKAFTREGSRCALCDSSTRVRALIHTLSTELFGFSLPIPDFPRIKTIKGLGLSDQPGCASALADRFDYINTYLGHSPRFDITEAHADEYGTYDFILSAEVFEHVVPPVERALEESSKLLKPNGILCMTVPYNLGNETKEHFPDLHQFAMLELGGRLVLVNRKRNGALEVREDLVLHGGSDAPLEMRVFCERDLRSKLLACGFRELDFLTQDYPQFGIVLEENWSLPLAARKGKFTLPNGCVPQILESYHRKVQELLLLKRSRWIKLGGLFGLGPKTFPRI